MCNHYTADAEEVAKQFYCLEALGIVAKPKPFMRSSEKWMRDYTDFKKTFVNNLAKMFYDYTVLVTYGEMRNAWEAASYVNKMIPKGSRGESYFDAKSRYTPESILKAGVKLFDKEVHWSTAYGGIKWQAIAKHGLKYGRVSNITFIDTAISLSHNSSPYVNKGETGIFTLYNDSSSYKNTLDTKRYERLFYVLSRFQNFAGEKLLSLIRRASVLGIISFPKWTPDETKYISCKSNIYAWKPEKSNKNENKIMQYFSCNSIYWENNTEELSSEITPKYETENEDEDEDEDEDEKNYSYARIKDLMEDELKGEDNYGKEEEKKEETHKPCVV